MKNKVLFIVTIVVVFLLGLLASSIINRKSEAKYQFTPKVSIGENEPRNEVWGENYPKEYQSYMKTADTTFASFQGGSATVDMLEEDPRFVILWAGYAFSKDYNQGRGHYYAIEDLHNSLRSGAPESEEDGPMPATCWTCKGPDVPRLMAEKGVEEFYAGTWAENVSEVVNPIGCADCHDPTNMKLRITRPALVEAFESMGKDINESSHQDMRSLVCAQCHVEYYFDTERPGSEGVPFVTLPWANGLSADNMEEYYDDFEFSDWTHQISRAPMLKAQHPDYELYMSGVHADRGVSCADCHMPYKSEGGQKFTDHHLQSPLNNIANSCQVCHREESTKLIANVYERQEKALGTRIKLEDMLVKAHIEAGKAWELGATEEQMHDILMDIRHAQWRWDFTAASHGGSFHAPVEIGRVLASGLNEAQEARVKLARLLATLGQYEPLEMPDISTKAKAQAYIGLDMEQLKADKKNFKENTLPKWLEEAREREAKMGSNKVSVTK